MMTTGDLIVLGIFGAIYLVCGIWVLHDMHKLGYFNIKDILRKIRKP